MAVCKFHIPDTLYAWLQAQAGATHRSVANLVVHFCREAQEKHAQAVSHDETVDSLPSKEGASIWQR